LAIEGNAPGIAQAPGVDFGTAFAALQRVIRGRGGGAGFGDVEAQDFAEEIVYVLAVAAGAVAGGIEFLVGFVAIVGIAAVAERGVEMAVASEGDATAVVVELGFVDLEEDFFRISFGAAGFGFEFGEGPGVVPAF
jgi:hypothetical protein